MYGQHYSKSSNEPTVFQLWNRVELQTTVLSVGGGAAGLSDHLIIMT